LVQLCVGEYAIGVYTLSANISERLSRTKFVVVKVRAIVELRVEIEVGGK
jgi:hypothetical protein